MSRYSWSISFHVLIGAFSAITKSFTSGLARASRFSAISLDIIAGVPMASASAVNMLNASCLLGFIAYLALDTSYKYFCLCHSFAELNTITLRYYLFP